MRSPRLWACVLVLLILAVLPLGVSGYILGVLTGAYYFGVFAMSWDLLFGFANEVNFGPTFLTGLGAYSAAILNMHDVPIPLCLAAGAATAVVGGMILALPALRLSGPYFGLTTLVAVLLLQQVIVIFAGFTGGEIGLTTNDVLFSGATDANYWCALAFMTVSGLILFGLSRSSVGLILQASGQDAIEAGALGFNVTKHKLAAFGVSALFSGLSGAMLVFYLGTASVNIVVDLTLGVQIIIAAILGGRRTIVGAAVGAIFLICATEALRPLGQLSTFVVSAIALCVILFFPNGMLGVMRQAGER